ncbi:nuclear transport factor 2 family protein [Thalassotalea ganghwensis]
MTKLRSCCFAIIKNSPLQKYKQRSTDPRYFTDFLSLVKVQGQWLIISKVFDHQLTPFT